MINFFDLLNFYKRRRTLKNVTPDDLADIIGINKSELKRYIAASDNIDKLYALLEKDPKEDIDFFSNRLSLSERKISGCLALIQIVSPGLVKKRQINGTLLDKSLNDQKIRISTDILFNSALFDHEIADKLNLPIQTVKARRKNLPTIVQRNEQFETIKKESLVREFFKLYQYATVNEASKSLNMHQKEVRTIIEGLLSYGEVVKFNNTPMPLEYEDRKADVIRIKRKSPGKTDKEISLELGISISQVRQAIQDTIRISQIERATSYEFYFTNTMEELSKVKDLAMDRHAASPMSSSRWLEIYLVAEEKQISMLGLKAPERLDINKNVTISRSDRDSMIDAFMATDNINEIIDLKKIEVTGV